MLELISNNPLLGALCYGLLCHVGPWLLIAYVARHYSVRSPFEARKADDV